MRDVSTARLWVLRATYLLIVVGLGVDIWPAVFRSADGVEHMRGVVRSMLAAVTLVAALGIRYPLQMLPLLLFELAWKTTWVLAIGLPLRMRGGLDAATSETWFACLMGLVIFPLAIPWGYVLANYVRRPGDRWRGAAAPAGVAGEPRAMTTAAR